MAVALVQMALPRVEVIFKMGSDATGALGPADSGIVADAWDEFSVRRPSPHRRHGDPFPLPRLGSYRPFASTFYRPHGWLTEL